MYENFFNFTCKPFELVPNPDFLFPSKSHKKAITYLDYGIKEKVGFILLSGEVGSGKTTLVRNLVRSIRGKSPLAIVFNTSVDSEQLIGLINEDFGLPVEGKAKGELIRDLNNFLIDQFGQGLQPILIVDEAQNLTPAHLEEIRLLSNLETDSAKLLQIILVGQPEIRTIIARPELRQLRQRISVSCHLDPLNRDEVEEYILHRMEKAGNRDAVTTSPEVFDAIHTYSRGIPRLINIICDFLLVAAYAEESRDLDLDLARDVLGDLDIDHRYWSDRVAVPKIAEQDALPAMTVMEKVLEQMQRLDEKIDSWEGGAASSQPGDAKETNPLILAALERFSKDLGLIYKNIQHLQHEIEGLKAQVKEQKNRPVPSAPPSQAPRPQPGFLKRMFG
ncbi:XrtA/PEP-CTERM system-associated ATPase [Geoalkalibacter halelectricus]|uniref:XrtA-associated ATPase n=1 Tax=Geoalkalibacter halelectricus TaxID=2847045 RepID=A0ABY5ZNZ8_9BACT|nr:XrtA/PEP-CTERM system-associated ATPase [Geoalkalibacter halelectricus]MDO3379701.1 XrtA-associated ATPase [Geoalkalibacter halelectricus]UWZ79600.1 XrtA-associated ATPase [Geoalkalibacter halelectricus]